MRYEIKGPDGSGIIYIEDTKEYKIIVDAGDAIYVFDTPESAKLSDLTNFPGFSQDIKITEKEARDDMESQGILVKTNNQEFLSGFLERSVNFRRRKKEIYKKAKDNIKKLFDYDNIKSIMQNITKHNEKIERINGIQLNLRPTDLNPEIYYKITELYEKN